MLAAHSKLRTLTSVVKEVLGWSACSIISQGASVAGKVYWRDL